jgi:hypothetical protein
MTNLAIGGLAVFAAPTRIRAGDDPRMGGMSVSGSGWHH